MTSSTLLEKLSRAPSSPGVYLMKDSKGNVIYVGKAKHLKKRLASYFVNKNHNDIKTSILLTKIIDFDTVITKTEQEALILEANLIKRHKPRYNVILKDDKRYPLIRIFMNSDYPFIERVRKIKNDGNLYFGPFASSSSLNNTLKIIHKTFKLRKCRTREIKKKTRPCLNYQMGNCLAPCVFDVSKDEYREIVKEVVLFLKGRVPDLIQKIKKEMEAFSEQQKFEKAAILRDKLFAIEKVLEKQIVVSNDNADRDVLAVVVQEELSLITILSVRNGFWVSTRHYEVDTPIYSENEIIETFINQYYRDSVFIPKEICIQKQLDTPELYENYLSEIKGKKVHIMNPVRGDKAHLVKLALQNAEKELKDRIQSGVVLKRLLERLQVKLHLGKFPGKIECFDNSNISGTEAVAGMVVFVDGTADKSLYRKFKIKTISGQDDYAYMKEVLARRFKEKTQDKPYPDVLMVDGGKGQLNIAVTILKDLNTAPDTQIIGIAKKDENKGETDDKIFIPGRSNPINFGKDREILLFLQRIRDEAHRFAISFHRKRRGKTAIHSVLDEVQGIGGKRKAILLETYEGVSKIRNAPIEELAGLPGMNLKVAMNLKKHLKTLS